MNSAATTMAALRKDNVLSRSIYTKTENTTFSVAEVQTKDTLSLSNFSLQSPLYRSITPDGAKPKMMK